MAYILNEQKIRINIFDADTKQIIHKNFLAEKGERFVQLDVVEILKDGTGYITLKFPAEGYEFEIKFIESHITALGYDYNSISGNKIKPVYDPDTQYYIYPFVVNIYMRKL